MIRLGPDFRLRQFRNQAAFAFRQEPELLAIRSALQSAKQRLPRVVTAIIGKSKSSIVNADGGSRVQDTAGFHRLCRRHMHGAHEPLRLIRADGQQSEAQGCEGPANALEKIAESGVTGEVDIPRCAFEYPSGPEGSVAIERSARGEVLRGNAVDLEGSPWLRLTPVILVDLAEADPAKRFRYAERTKHYRLITMP